MKCLILSLLFLPFLQQTGVGQSSANQVRFDFYGNPVSIDFDSSIIIPFNASLNNRAILDFNVLLSRGNYQSIIQILLYYKDRYKLDDWLYYQLIRKVAQHLSPKKENYTRYTLYKWFLLVNSGYDARLKINAEKILFYVQSEDNIYNIPSYQRDGKQFVCLNYHDYNSFIDFEKEHFNEVTVPGTEPGIAFSYKVNKLPAFSPGDYKEKDIFFNLNETEYHFKVKLNPEIKSIFANYPVVDYESYFNIPLSRETYNSLFPQLKQTVKGMTTRNGVDYLMRFTRYAFLFAPDSETFGNEKRLSPEQTLLYEHSDCEDRAALFFYLVREIYDLPMIVLVFPSHVTVAVNFEKPIGHTISYLGKEYSVCEPTPYKKDLRIGQLLPDLAKASFVVAYAYSPK